MCALCISYLKHAAYFRDQVIKNALGLKAAASDKDSLLITSSDLIYSEERKTDTNLLFSSENRDKVHKLLLNNAGRSTIAAGDVENEQLHMHYLNLLFDKDTNNVRARTKFTGNRNIERYDIATGSDPFAEDFQTASSDDNDASEQKQNFFSYREKNFQEDDIMDFDELKDAITINIPESCKERKCRACFRRFMFEETYKEHIDTCIEYKFLTTIEEINRLLDIRRGKAISPHEFIRRMIFCLRKTCEWLKANCGDMLLPDLLQNGEGVKKRIKSEGKSSTAEASSGGNNGGCGVEKLEVRTQKLAIGEKLSKSIGGVCSEGIKEVKANMTDFAFKRAIANNDILLKQTEKVIEPLFANPKSLLSRSRNATPISIENNVLYEIERSQSRNKQEILTNKSDTPVQEQERITFLQKLQNAANSNNTAATNTITPIPALPPPASPMISVRKDLLPTTPTINKNTSMISVAVVAPTTPTTANLMFSARCQLCNIVFATVAALEEHNALYHNAQQLQEQLLEQHQQQRNVLNEMDERDKIIALFEESSSDE